MDFNKLRKKLGEKYWNINEYFNESFEILKYVLKTNWGKLILFTMLASNLSIFNNPIMSKIGLVSSYILMFLMIFSIKNVIELIEEKKTLSKAKMLFRMSVVNFIKISILTFILIIRFNSNLVNVMEMDNQLTIDGKIQGSILAIIPDIVIGYLIVGIIFMIFLLYFEMIYYTRNINFMEALKYNIHISKGNRMRMIKPLIMMKVITTIPLFFFFVINMVVILIPMLKIFQIIILNLRYMTLLYGVILTVVIYLNVEYIDLEKNKNNDKEEELELKNEIDAKDKENNIIEFRKTEIGDIERVMEIFEKAKKEMERLGFSQWNEDYPNIDVVKEDVEKGESYVLIDNGIIVATGMLTFNGEEAYKNVVSGKWLKEGPYGTIHRFAVDKELMKKGYATKLMKNFEKESKLIGIDDLKVDTFEENIPMREYLIKNNFIYCCDCVYKLDNKEIKVMGFEKILT